MTNPRTKNGGLGEIPEPTANITIQGIFEIPEPSDDQIPEPFEIGEEIDGGILSSHTRLWRLESYADRHGKQRARRVLRFVTRPEPKIELGQLSRELAAELRARPGRGRWRGSREEAESLRRVAVYVAESFRGDPGRWRRSQNPSKHSGRNIDPASDNRILPEPSDNPFRTEVSTLLM